MTFQSKTPSPKPHTLRARLQRLWHTIGEHLGFTVKVIDDKYWRPLTDNTNAPLVRPWYEQRDLLDKIYELCRTNPHAHRLVEINTDFVIGAKATLTGPEWAHRFWDHPQNRLNRRVYHWAQELSRSGELFIILSRNPVDKMSYCRELPAIVIDQIETDPNDAEKPLRYHQLTGDVEGHWWPAYRPDIGQDPDQVMLHFTVNRPTGDLRGHSDLEPLQPWLERYALWLEDRVRINRFKSAYLWQVAITNALPGQLEQKRAQYAKPPTSGSIIVTDANESWTAIQPHIAADDVEADGRALRLMVASGAGTPLHWLAEGESATRATAREMNAPTYRKLARRQAELEFIIRDVIETAAKRAGHPRIKVDIKFESVLTVQPDILAKPQTETPEPGRPPKNQQPETEND